LIATDKCLARIPDMNIKMLQNIYEMISETNMMYGIELWGVYDAWKETAKIHGTFVKNIGSTTMCCKWSSRNQTRKR
jgi:hypothetical protein